MFGARSRRQVFPSAGKEPVPGNLTVVKGNGIAEYHSRTLPHRREFATLRSVGLTPGSILQSD